MIVPDRFAPWVSAEAQALFRLEAAAPPAPADDIDSLRTFYDDFNRRHLDHALRHYPVEIAREERGGVPVDIVTPRGGTADPRTLLCLHGGAFMWGRGAGALLEAVPVAATLGVRVVAVEYSLAPERIFPAAVNDILAVYHDACAATDPRSIGIYGCSAGAVLTAQTVARLLEEEQPLPGAIAMLCGAGLEMTGDSAQTAGPLSGRSANEGPTLAALPYLASADPTDPLVFPGEHPDVLAGFPPALLVTGTRDFAASSVATMHRRLVAAGRDAELLMLDGMWHAFHMATTLPEACETFGTIARFFKRRLG